MRSLLFTVLTLVLQPMPAWAQSTALDIFHKADAIQAGQASSGLTIMPIAAEPFHRLEAALQDKDEAREVLREVSLQLIQRRRELSVNQLELRLFVVEILGGASSAVQNSVHDLLKHPHPAVQWRALMALRKLRGTHSLNYQIRVIEFLEWLDNERGDVQISDDARIVLLRDLIGDEGRVMARVRAYLNRSLEASVDGYNHGILVLEALKRSRRFYLDQILAGVLINSLEVYKRHRKVTGREGAKRVQIDRNLRRLLVKTTEVALAKNVRSPVVAAYLGQLADDGVLAGADHALKEFIQINMAGAIDRAACDQVLRGYRYF